MVIARNVRDKVWFGGDAAMMSSQGGNTLRFR